MAPHRRQPSKSDPERVVNLKALKSLLFVPALLFPCLTIAQVKPSDWRKTSLTPAQFAKQMDQAILNVKGAYGEATYETISFARDMGKAFLFYRVRDKKTFRVDMVAHAISKKDPFSSQSLVGNNGKVGLISGINGFRPLLLGVDPKLVPTNISPVSAWPKHFQQSIFQSYVTGKGGFGPFVQGLLKGDGGYTLKMESRTMIGGNQTVPQVRLFANRTPAAAKKLGSSSIEIIAASKMMLPLQIRVIEVNLKGQRRAFDWTCLWRGPVRHDNQWFVLPKK